MDSPVFPKQPKHAQIPPSIAPAADNALSLCGCSQDSLHALTQPQQPHGGTGSPHRAPGDLAPLVQAGGKLPESSSPVAKLRLLCPPVRSASWSSKNVGEEGT